MNIYYSDGRIEQLEGKPFEWFQQQGYTRESTQHYPEGNLEIWSKDFRTRWAIYHPKMGALSEVIYADLNQFEAEHVVELVFNTAQLLQTFSRGKRDRLNGHQQI